MLIDFFKREGEIGSMDDLTRWILVSSMVVLLSLSCDKPVDESIYLQSQKPIVYFSFDEYSIPWKNNLQLSMAPPQKHHANPVLPRGGVGSVDEHGVQFYGSVIRHDGKFKMWYVAMDDESLPTILNSEKQKDYSGLRPAYAESMDGVLWEKPDLGLVEYKGDKHNNLVLMDPAVLGGIHLIVLHEPEDIPDKQFKMLLTIAADMNRGKVQTETSVVLFSPDGLRWKSAAELKLHDGVLSEESVVLPHAYIEQGGLYRWKGSYHLAGQQFNWWKAGEKNVGRVMKIFRSPDLINWDDAMSFSFRRDAHSSAAVKAGSREEAHLAASVWNRNNILLGVYGLWHGADDWQERSMDLGLLFSNDGIHFREPVSDYIFIERGEKGEWDQGGLLQGQGFENVGDSTYIYYGSWDMTRPDYPPRGGVGLVTMRRDGFGYLELKDRRNSAHLVTRDVIWDGGRPDCFSMYLNVDGVNEGTPIKVELVDQTGVPITEFAGDNAGAIARDGTRALVEWPQASNGLHLSLERDFAAKIHLPANSDVRLYSIYFETCGSIQ